MKEYKAVYYQRKSFFSQKKYLKELEDFLNTYARQGWRVVEAHQSFTYYLLERDKN